MLPPLIDSVVKASRPARKHYVKRISISSTMGRREDRRSIRSAKRVRLRRFRISACVRRKTCPNRRRPQLSLMDEAAQTGRERNSDANASRGGLDPGTGMSRQAQAFAPITGEAATRSPAFRLRRSGNGQDPKSGSGKGLHRAFHQAGAVVVATIAHDVAKWASCVRP